MEPPSAASTSVPLASRAGLASKQRPARLPDPIFFHALVVHAIRSSASLARHRARPRIERHRAGAGGWGARRPGGRRHGRGGRPHASDVFWARPRRAAVGPRHAQPDLRFSNPLPGRARLRPGHGLRHPPARHRGRPDRGQCAAWRPHVAARQPDRGGADRVVERGRRLGRPGSRLYPARQRHRLQDRPGLSPAPLRHARAGRLRRRRGHRRRLRRALGRRFLRLRADHRQLFDRLARPGRHGGAGRLFDRASLRARPARH